MFAVSRFPFLTKLCFSKWSEIEQKPGDSTTLRFCSVPRTPWLLHKSEHGVPTTEFPISCTTVMDGCGGGDCTWTLWVLDGMQNQWQHQHPQYRDQDPQDRKQYRETEQNQQWTPRVVEESAVTTADDSDQLRTTCPSESIIRREPTGADDNGGDEDSGVVDFIGMLRNCLCDISNDRGDVLCGAAAMRVEQDNADVVASNAADAASQSGPLGDA